MSGCHVKAVFDVELIVIENGSKETINFPVPFSQDFPNAKGDPGEEFVEDFFEDRLDEGVRLWVEKYRENAEDYSYTYSMTYSY